MRAFIVVVFYLTALASPIDGKSGCKKSAFQAALETIAYGINQGTPAGAVLAASVFRDDAVLIGPGINVLTNKADIQAYFQTLIDSDLTVSDPAVTSCSGSAASAWAIGTGGVNDTPKKAVFVIAGEKDGEQLPLTFAAWGEV